MKPKKLDKRMLGHGEFKYQVAFNRRDCQKFVDIRIWCWEQWGPSCELEFTHTMKHKPTWAWMSDYHDRYRLLFETDKECSWYILNWIN